MLKGEPALVDSPSPRRGEKASYYSAVCLETGEVEVMELVGQQQLGYLSRLPETAAGAAHRTTDGDLGQFPSPSWRGIRAYLTTSGLDLRLVNLPVTAQTSTLTRPSGLVRHAVTANRCLGTRAAGQQEKVDDFFANLANHREEVKRRCRPCASTSREMISQAPAIVPALPM